MTMKHRENKPIRDVQHRCDNPDCFQATWEKPPAVVSVREPAPRRISVDDRRKGSPVNEWAASRIAELLRVGRP